MLEINERLLDVNKISYIGKVKYTTSKCWGFFIIIDGVRIDFSYESNKDSAMALKNIITKAISELQEVNN